MTAEPVSTGDLDDLAAELDDDEDDPGAADTAADPVEPIHYYTGNAQGGPRPYPGKLLVSRYPSGILLTDKSSNRAWVYDYDAAGGLYRCRGSDTGDILDEAGRWRAAEGGTYEVRAYDDAFAGDEPPDVTGCPMPGCDDDGGTP